MFNRSRLAAALLLCVLAGTANAQIAGNDPSNTAGNSAWQNSQNVAGRAPGLLVISSIARQQAVILSPNLTFNNITETGEDPSDRWLKDFYIDALELIFERINQAALLIGNIIVAQAGGTPILPDVSVDDLTDLNDVVEDPPVEEMPTDVVDRDSIDPDDLLADPSLAIGLLNKSANPAPVRKRVDQRIRRALRK